MQNKVKQMDHGKDAFTRATTKDFVVEHLGITRMAHAWRQQLWIDFARDRALTTMQEWCEETQNADTFKELTELRLDNHSATEQYLTDLSDHVRFQTRGSPLVRLEIDKVLFTPAKTELLIEIISHHNCQITDLLFKKCRAKSEKMGLIFGAIATN